MSCVCSVACAAGEPPQFLTVALKVVSAALSVQSCQCRVSATEIQLAALPAPAQLPWAPSAGKAWADLGHLCVSQLIFSF